MPTVGTLPRPTVLVDVGWCFCSGATMYTTGLARHRHHHHHHHHH
eukprot:COSAG05_NODE_7467_length_807_cov_1.146893_1_plen_44_part_01